MMNVNPFGDSDSKHAWQQKYQQMEFQANTLRTIVAETKAKLQAITEERDQLLYETSNLDNQLSEIKQELLVFKDLSKTRAEKITQLERSLNTNRIASLMEENKELREKIEDLQGEIARGSVQTTTQVGTDITDQLMTSLIPLMLHLYDKDNERYSDAYQNLVEFLIENGNVLTKIIAVLVKYGGNGPINRVREIVNEEDFYVALDIFIEENILVKIDDNVQIITLASDYTNEKNWESLELSEIFDQLLYVVDNESSEVLVKTLNLFRDLLQEREVPATTIFFEIRKIGEAISKNKITRKEVIETINKWKDKIIQE